MIPRILSNSVNDMSFITMGNTTEEVELEEFEKLEIHFLDTLNLIRL